MGGIAREFELENYQADTQDEIWALNDGELVKVEVEDDAGND